jgi:hypothetical protein
MSPDMMDWADSTGINSTIAATARTARNLGLAMVVMALLLKYLKTH